MMTEPGVIQVTPQDKEAIERVRKSLIDKYNQTFQIYIHI